MKTTIELPDALARRAKELARQRGTTLREVIVAGLRAELDRLATPPEERSFTFRTVGGSGLQPGVEPAQLTDLAYEDAAR